MTAQHSVGFTLLEVLVALVVLGFLVVGLTQGVQFGFHAWRMQTRVLAERDDLDAVDRALRRLVAQADPGDAVEHPAFNGGPNKLEFITELPAAADMLATSRVDAALLVNQTHQLILLWTLAPHVERLGPAPPPHATELLRNVDHLELAYWRPAAAGGEWQMSWTLPYLPTLVRIRIVFRADDTRHWPDIVVAPMREGLGL